MTANIGNSAGVVINDLNLSFGETHVLKGVNLSIEAGEFFAFLGPSGSGKSTLLRAIAGFGPQPTGRILIDGEDIADQPPWKRNVGMVFQSYALWPHMTVHRNVAFGLEERGVPAPEIKRRVDAALDMVGLIDLAERRPSQLSGGQQQRIALARTVVVEPKVLLLDEPLSNLDANLRVQMRREIRDLQKALRLTTIFVTHDQEEANTTSDRMAVLDEGVIQQVGAPVELYDKPSNLFVANFLGTANVLQGTISIGKDRKCTFQSENGVAINLGAQPQNEGAVVFRPQNVRISKAGTNCKAGNVQFQGTVGHMEFHGNIVRYGVDVSGHLILIDETHQRGSTLFDIGTSVDLQVKQGQIMVVPGH